MTTRTTIRSQGKESGVALLLAIFVLLLVAVVGIAMMAASGTEVSLTGNYQSSTASYYAALSGLEEGRARLLPKDANYLGNLSPPAIPPIGTSLPLGHVIYITNPLTNPAETVDPTNLGNPQTYPDTEYKAHFPPAFYPPSDVRIVNSVAGMTGQPNALYKWVRINAIDEWAISVDVNYTNPGDYSAFNIPQIISFDGTNLTHLAAPYQALEITSLAALPDGSRKLLQYVVAPVALQIPISAALTIAGPGFGNGATFNPPPGATSFYVNGTDQCATPTLPLPGVGVTNADDYNAVHQSLNTPSPNKDHYIGADGTFPNVSSVTPDNTTVHMADPISLSNFLPIVKNAADSVLNGPRTEADMPSAMTPSNPMTIYVNGPLTLNNSFTGYGLLVVRGNLTYSGDSGWKGIVIVLGGTITETGSQDGGEFDGAVYLANLTGVTLGAPTYIVSNPGGKGVYYNSCWISSSLKPISYKILSFREIPYP